MSEFRHELKHELGTAELCQDRRFGLGRRAAYSRAQGAERGRGRIGLRGRGGSIRYFVAHNFVCNFDSYTGSMVHNYYLYEEDGILSMLPWDYNLAFGGFMSGSDATSLVNWDIDEPVSGGTVESRPMLAWIFESEEYTELYHEIFAEFIDSVFTSGWFEELMDETVSLIAPYVELDPTKFCTYKEFELGVEALREFCLLRAESITYQLAGEDVTVDAGALDVSDMGSMNMGGERRVDFEPGTW